MLFPKLSIFVSHPSELLTNCRSYSDGLLAFGLTAPDFAGQICIVARKKQP